MERWWGRSPQERVRRPGWSDLAVAVVVTAISIAPREKHDHFAAAPGAILGLAAGASIVFRRVRPLPVLAAVEVALLLQVFIYGTDLRTVGLGAAVAMFTVARTSDRPVSSRVALAAGGLDVAGLLLAWLIGRPGNPADVVPLVVLIAGSWGIGDNVRTRRSYLASLRDRAERAEREREENALRAVLEERTRIARELHDVVAHHVSAIAVIAGAAEERALDDPQRARDALRTIQAASRQSLREMRALLGVLEGGGVSEAQLAPPPSLLDVERLVEQSQATGLAVSLRIEGRQRALPEALDLTAYRIVQEALTNTMRHARASRAEVTVRYTDDALELIVGDDGRHAGDETAVDGGGGRGLIGMRERVALFHGELEAGPRAAGGYRVAARLPLGDGPS